MTWRRRLAAGAASLLLLVPGVALAATPIEEVVALTNLERAAAGLAPLTLDPALQQAAQSYADTMASTGCFGHACGTTASFVERNVDLGYTDWTAMGENVAAGQPTAQQVVDAWMDSPEHRANILNPSYTELGVGLATGSAYGTQWVQEFGSQTTTAAPAPVAPAPVSASPAPAPSAPAPAPSAPAPELKLARAPSIAPVPAAPALAPAPVVRAAPPAAAPSRPQNHGAAVSGAAKDRSLQGAAHGQAVAAVAHTKPAPAAAPKAQPAKKK